MKKEISYVIVHPIYTNDENYMFFNNNKEAINYGKKYNYLVIKLISYSSKNKVCTISKLLYDPN